MDRNENREGYKLTKLGWMPEDWSLAKLGTYFQFKNGLNKEKEAFGTGVFIINYTDVYKNLELTSENIHGKVSISKNEIKRFEVKEGDVFFTRTSETIDEIGLTSVVTTPLKDTVFSGFLLRARPIKSGLHNLYKKYCFSTFSARKDIIRKSTYTTRALTNGVFLSDVSLIIPPLREQMIIGTTISTWDRSIQSHTQLIEQKKLRKKWLMQVLLTGKKRLPGFDRSWEVQKLGKYFTERNENGYDQLPLLSVGEAGVYYQNESNKRDISNEDKSLYKRICIGDIGYNTMRMWQGRSALSDLEGIVSPAYTIVKPKARADAEFFAYFFKLPSVVHKFYRNSQGLVSDTLNCKFKDFAIVKVELPVSKEEKTAIAIVLHTADKEIEILTRKLGFLKEQKKGLMQQLLTGTKRLNFK